MTSRPLTFIGTQELATVRLRMVTLGRVPLTMYGIIVLIFAVISYQTRDPWPFLLAAFLLLFFTHIMKLFLEEELENDALPMDTSAPVESWLSHEMIVRLAPKKHASAGDLLEAAIQTGRGQFLLEELGINADDMINRCRMDIEQHVELALFLDYAKQSLSKFNETRIDANIVLYLFFTYVQCCTDLLNKADLSEEDLVGLLHWEHFHYHFRLKTNPWSPEAIAHNSSLGRSWIMGYTDALDMLTTEMDAVREMTGERSVVIHQESIDAVLRMMTRSKERNVLILGKTGVGKRTLIQNVVGELRNREREKHQPFTRVLLLQTEKLLSGVESPDAFLLNALSRAQQGGRFILVFRDLALLLRSANPNLMAVLKKFLESSSISVIGIADTQDYHALIKTDPMLDSLFQKVTIEDASDEETMETLMAHYFALQSHHVRITYKALKSILELTKRFLSMRGGLPGNALDVMDEAVYRAHELGDAFVREDHVRAVISTKSRVNVEHVSEGEKERLLILEDAMKSRIIEQDNAIHAVVSSLKRARMDLRERHKPVGTFLFLGPTGVGKTETAKVLAEQYYGAADAMIRLDMNEYSHTDSVFGVIGQPGSSEGFLAQRVQDKPFSLILLDEIEKAHSTVLNLFLQILDEGFLTDSRGTRTDFRNTIIIATSNAGALFIRDFVKDHAEYDKQTFKAALLDSILQQKLFSPEFVNRFDEVVLFYPLAQTGATKVAKLMLDSIIQDLQKRRGITVTLEDDVIGALVERGYSVQFGAREMRRTITDMIEDYLADYLLRHDVKRGDTIIIHRADLKW
jgi:ATP-dependent Clp protease ATP-binding subunit ClpC